MTGARLGGSAMPSKSSSFVAPITRVPRLSDRVAEKLLETILQRELKPGDKLPSERELGEQFQVSRTVIREATRGLVAKGIIDVRSGTGLTVTAVDPASVAASMNLYLRGGDVPYQHVHEVRAVLEIEVAAAAAERGTDEKIAALRAIHDRMVAEHKRGDKEAFAVTDVDFHRAIAKMTGNELYVLLLDAMGDSLLGIRRALSANSDSGVAKRNQSVAIRAHKRILDTIEARDPAGARIAMNEHLTAVYQNWAALGHAG